MIKTKSGSIFNVQGVELTDVLPLGPQSRSFESRWYRLHHYAAGFHTIDIPKSMSSTVNLVLCDLVRKQRGLPERILIEKQKNICVKDNWYNEIPEKKLNWKMRGNHPALIVLRDPIERFVSMYGYLCKEKHLCPKRMGIHQFAAWTNRLLNEKAEKKRIWTDLLRHIQPSFWYVYENRKSLPHGNVEVVFQTTDRKSTARQFERIFVRRGVPSKIAHWVTHLIREKFVNSNKGNKDVKGIRDTTTAKKWKKQLELKPELIRALRKHRIELPDEIRLLEDGGAVLRDNCMGPRLGIAGKSIPRRYCKF
ncbi:unnamed protein product, partial [Mesorhabditis belari]|uniref:Sulfotransferase domain-containing protein n=1 Tax=Mesorhabditis belari TaxID=2138241 RepID=A0AAF3FJY8_9BILA